MTAARAPAFAVPAAVPGAARGLSARCARRTTVRAAASPDAPTTAVPAASAASAASAAPAAPAAITSDGPIAGANGLDAELAPAVASFADVDEIVRLADEFDLGDLRIESGGVCVEITRAGGRGFVDGVLRQPPAPVVAPAPVALPVPQQLWAEEPAIEGDVQDVAAAAVEPGDGEDDGEEKEEAEVKKPADPNVVYDSDFVVTSNRVGFFFSGARNKPPLVNVGDHVAFNQPVCIIEQLGQQYVYLSEVSGTVTKIFVEDGDAVQYDQQVMVIRPD